jgi:phosphoglucosamine mutase
VKDKTAAAFDKNVKREIENIEKALNGRGRVLLRQSGTEPVIRIMVEAQSCQRCVEYAETVARAIRDGGHCVE